MRSARLLLPLTTILVSACGLLVGIDPDLSVAPTDVPPDAAEAGNADAMEASIDSAADVEAGPLARRPPEGVYEFDVSGSNKLEHPPITPEDHPYGPATVTITHDASCFYLQIELRQGHEELHHFCLRGPDIVEDKGSRNPSFSGFATAYTCSPGDVYFTTSVDPSLEQHDCMGNDDTANPNPANAFRITSTYTYIAQPSTKVIDGKNVPIRIFEENPIVVTSATDHVHGGGSAHWVFATETGMLVHLDRDATLVYPAPFPVPTTSFHEVFSMDLVRGPDAMDGGADADADAD